MADTTRPDASNPRHLRHRRQARLAGIAAALLATAHWCHPPTPDINIFHNRSGQIADNLETAPDGAI